MIVIGSRRDFERQAIRQFLDGMRDAFPTLVPGWLAEAAHTDDWHDLGAHIARAIMAHPAPPPNPNSVLSFLATPPAPDQSAELRALEQRWQNAEAARQREAERARRAESQAAQSQQELHQAQHQAAAQIARLQDEITHLRRIVGEQQFRLNQLNQLHD
jgi:hypothetical protein